MTQLVMVSRRRKGLDLHTPAAAARGLVRALHQGRKVALMVDIPEAGPTVVVQYCGGPVVVSVVPARLAAAQHVPILPVACWRQGNRWQLFIGAPMSVSRGEEADTMAQLAAVLERDVRAHPEQWYPFHQVYADG
ncbi:MAG: lysophospholipid acyltransferase family protein [Candidatus Dormibacteraeota bacterium]|nr:lysophospholipid acyltransferase family protein [Candidatus Dormibacteraeota bacterium]